MIRRTYACNGCELEWTVTHDSSEEPVPSCPVCTVKSQWVPKPLRIRGNRSKATDIAQQTAEAMGITNMKDSTREGESAAMMPRDQTQPEADAVMHQTVDAMRQLANASSGTVSPQMADFLQATTAARDPTSAASAPTNLIGPNVLQMPQQPGQIAAMAANATAQAKQLTGGMTPTAMLHRAMKTRPNNPLRDGPMLRYKP